LKASNQPAKEQGQCSKYGDTQYAKGILPIDSFKADVNDICDTVFQCDWRTLRINIAKHRLRNSTLTALMPSESSSQISNASNGIERTRGYISEKSSKDGILKQVVLELRDKYELLWDMPSNEGYLNPVGVMQKFIDQAISANTNYDPAKFAEGKVPMKQLLKDLLTAYKLGLKTLYYHNTRDGANDAQNDLEGGCAGACKI